MFNISTPSRRELENVATDLLRACGCSPDGRPVEDVDVHQYRFEQRLSYQTYLGVNNTDYNGIAA